MHVRVPEVVHARAGLLGAPGRAWVEALDGLVGDLARRWDLTLDEQLAGGTAAVVLRGRDGEGRPAVLKLGLPDQDQAQQIGTLLRARGRGYARVLAADPDRHAVLLEALGPSLDRGGLPPEEQLRILCDVLAEAWTAPPAAGQQPLDKAGQLHELVSRLWRELDQPCAPAVVERALACAAARSAAPPARVVVHGDAAPPNCLLVAPPRPGAECGYALVDPDGFLGDPAYDLGVALRDWSPQLLAAHDAPAVMRRWCDLVSGRTGLDPAAVGDWAFLERVSTGLFATSLGMAALGRDLLRSAALLTAGAPSPGSGPPRS